MGKGSDLIHAVHSALSGGLYGWNIESSMNPEVVNMSDEKSLYMELDEQGDGDFSDSSIPSMSIVMLLSYPIGQRYTEDRENLSTAVDEVQTKLNESKGFPAPTRFYVRYSRGVLGNGAHVLTAALSLEWENII